MCGVELAQAVEEIRNNYESDVLFLVRTSSFRACVVAVDRGRSVCLSSLDAKASQLVCRVIHLLISLLEFHSVLLSLPTKTESGSNKVRNICFYSGLFGRLGQRVRVIKSSRSYVNFVVKGTFFCHPGDELAKSFPCHIAASTWTNQIASRIPAIRATQNIRITSYVSGSIVCCTMRSFSSGFQFLSGGSIKRREFQKRNQQNIK